MRPVIFVVDDDPALGRLLRCVLEAEGFAVQTFTTAQEVLRQETKPNLFLLDRELPDKEGLQLCLDLRQSALWADVPVIFVTAKNSESDRVAGLRIADDYVVKPFSCLELAARVRAVLRRTHQPQGVTRYSVGELELDSESMTVRMHGRPVSVTAMEFRLLEHLAAHPGRTFCREQLLDAVWDARFVTPRTVDVHVRRLREKIEAQPDSPQYLITTRGKGYRFVPPSSLPIPMPQAGPAWASVSRVS
ncbi:MAG TPA: response regulator transcription factor [Candidatus Sulfotelmatobacter sp.]|nr:response regulator transcription factor [Candidatus Sulfotelmatobacter sp.]